MATKVELKTIGDAAQLFNSGIAILEKHGEEPVRVNIPGNETPYGVDMSALFTAKLTIDERGRFVPQICGEVNNG